MSDLVPTSAQRAAVETLDRALMVEAGAGTGKTWALVRRFMHLLEVRPDWPLESIVAVTFTEKAAREMRTRIREAVEKRAADEVRAAGEEQEIVEAQAGVGRRTAAGEPAAGEERDAVEAQAAAGAGAGWQTRRRDLDRLQVSTIHSLCARLLRENAVPAALDPRFRVLDEIEAALLKDEAIRLALQALNRDDGGAQGAETALALLASLRVTDLRGELENILDRRGTLVRLFEGLADPGALMTRWAEGLAEMQTRLWEAALSENPDLPGVMDEVLGVEIADPGDKLAAAVEHAQTGVRAARRGDLPGAVAEWAQINRAGGRADAWGGKEAKDRLSKDLLAPLQDVGKKLAGPLSLEIGEMDAAAAENLQLWRSLWDRIEAVYARLKDERAALDFDDLELRTAALLARSPRPPRLAAYLAGINHLMVDEFQDTNLVQQEIVYALAPPDDPGRLFIVGDAKQSIYRFRQAQVSLFTRTAADIRAATGQPPVYLDVSFRTHAALVAAHNHLFERLFAPLSGERADFEARPGPLEASRAAHPALPAPVELALIPDVDSRGERVGAAEARVQEARWLARRLLALHDGRFQVRDREKGYRDFEFKDAAVLFRATTGLPLYEAEFKAAGLPYLAVSGRGYYDRPEVRDLLALLAALANPGDDLSLATALRSPLFSLSDETLYRLRWWGTDGTRTVEPVPYFQALAGPPETDQPAAVTRAGRILADLRLLAGRVDAGTLLREALDRTGYEAILARHDGETGRQRSNVGKLIAIARRRDTVELPTFLAGLRDLQAREAREGEALGREPESGAVQLMSIHAAKGLEFPVVAVADLGRQNRAGFGKPYLLHDPEFGLACRVRDARGDWQDPAGYAWAEWLDGRMEAAERKRLLYVACTRAADLLVLSGRLGMRDSWLTEVREVFEVEADGSDEETLDFEGFAVRVLRAPDVSPFPPAAAEAGGRSDGLDEIPALARSLPEPAGQPGVTGIAGEAGEEAEGVVVLRPVIRAGAEDPEAPPRATDHVTGLVVHRALAHWNCLEFPDQKLHDLLAGFARREGAAEAVLVETADRAARMLENFRRHPLHAQIAAAERRYPELPFTVTTAAGPRHGVIDLLYRDAEGSWRIVDWNTESVEEEALEATVAGHAAQLALYRRAVQAVLGVVPEAGLVFIRPVVRYFAVTGSDNPTG